MMMWLFLRQRKRKGSDGIREREREVGGVEWLNKATGHSESCCVIHKVTRRAATGVTFTPH